MLRDINRFATNLRFCTAYLVSPENNRSTAAPLPELTRGGEERGGSYHGVRGVAREMLAGSRLVRASLVVGDSSPDFPLRRWSQSTACTSNWEAKGSQKTVTKVRTDVTRRMEGVSGARGCSPHRKSSTTAAEMEDGELPCERPGGLE